MVSALRQVRVHSAGVRTAVRVGGSKGCRTPVVLVHGLIVSSRSLLPTATRLAASRLVAAPDLPGFGRTGRPRRPLLVPGLADALAEIADQLTGPALFVGHSFGCGVVTELAVRRADLVRGLVLVSPAVDPQIRQFKPASLRWMRTQLREPASLYPIILASAWRAGLREDRATVGDALRYAIEERLPAVDARGLVVRGQHDLIVSRSWAMRVTDLLARARCVELAGAHSLPFTMPDAVARLVIEELDRT